MGASSAAVALMRPPRSVVVKTVVAILYVRRCLQYKYAERLMPKLTTKLTRADFQTLADKRLREATILFNAAQYDGAIYLAGYAVECALKACIARQTQQHGFPDKDTVNRSYTHVLIDLLGLAGYGLKEEDDERLRDVAGHAEFTRDWALVGQWHEDDRYRSGASAAEARDFVGAAQRIVDWIRPSW
jgi:HEPN domain-containing protein